MTELERLKDIISKGYQPGMFLRKDIPSVEREKLPEPCWNKEMYALPLHNFSNGKKLMFYLE